MVRDYFNYLHFHTLAITPIDTTIPEPTVRLIAPSFTLLQPFFDLECVTAQQIMVQGRF